MHRREHLWNQDVPQFTQTNSKRCDCCTCSTRPFVTTCWIIPPQLIFVERSSSLMMVVVYYFPDQLKFVLHFEQCIWWHPPFLVICALQLGQGKVLPAFPSFSINSLNFASASLFSFCHASNLRRSSASCCNCSFRSKQLLPGWAGPTFWSLAPHCKQKEAVHWGQVNKRPSVPAPGTKTNM